MKILHTVEFYFPSVGGMQEVVKQLSERLAKLGHDVTVATSRVTERRELLFNGVMIEEFELNGNFAKAMTGEVDRYRQFLLESDFDVITNFAAQQWATDTMITILDQIKAKKVFVPTGFSGLSDPVFNDYFEAMKLWMKKYDMNVFHSESYRDMDFARRNGISNTIQIPNGASEDEFLTEPNLDIRKKLNIPPGHFLILHVGSHSGMKGHDDAIRIFSKSSIKHATLLIVASDSGGGCLFDCKRKMVRFNKLPWHKLSHKNLLVTSLSRPETIAAYFEADLFLFPSNVECSPIVLFESMASRTPFLTTDVGNSSEISRWSNSGIVLPTKKDKRGFSKADIPASANLLEEIYWDEEKRAAMKVAGFKAWQDKFTWSHITNTYEKLYHDLLNEA